MVELCSAAVMAVRGLRDVSERGHLLGGVLLFVVVSADLIVLAPAKLPGQRGSRSRRVAHFARNDKKKEARGTPAYSIHCRSFP